MKPSSNLPRSSLVLVLDDDDAVRASLAARVEESLRRLKLVAGIQVLSARSRNEALAMLAAEGVAPAASSLADLLRKPLALALVDQRLGDYDPVGWPDDVNGAEGLAFVELLKGMLLPPQVLMLTAHAKTADTQGFAARGAGADAYVDKADFSPAQLHQLLETHLRYFFDIEYLNGLAVSDGN